MKAKLRLESHKKNKKILTPRKTNGLNICMINWLIKTPINHKVSTKELIKIKNKNSGHTKTETVIFYTLCPLVKKQVELQYHNYYPPLFFAKDLCVENSEEWVSEWVIVV